MLRVKKTTHIEAQCFVCLPFERCSANGCARGVSRHTARAGATRPESAQATGDANKYIFSEIKKKRESANDPRNTHAQDSVKPIRAHTSPSADRLTAHNERAIKGRRAFQRNESSQAPVPDINRSVSVRLAPAPL
ncbi:unnamed protein product [Danaus chrysippus]|uniref:(African queen) hypothetical protein n=1 Tax=Danaus chrysippus TaxID=151541 RepID=A0A8J2VQK6_9NEOP|nr:unnamed protein product [Danaus chrysippus]